MRRSKWVDLGVKTLLLLLIVAAIISPDLAGLKEKAATARLIVYPVGAVVVPLWWLLARRVWRRGIDYPWTADLLVTAPWVLDLAGNRLNLFDGITWWDDAMHFVNWALLTAGVLLIGVPTSTSRGLVVMCALGFGATAAVVWELGEYITFLRASPELQTAYTDTLGDLCLGTLGSLLAGLLLAQLRLPAAPKH